MYVDNLSIAKKSLLNKISLCVKTTSNNVIFLYIKLNQIGKKKLFELYENVIEVNMILINNLKEVETVIQVFDLILKKILEMILELKLKIYLVLKKLKEM